jgi:hypothetical protein
MRSDAPWTEDEVDKLNQYQRCSWVHPFTCGGERGDWAHRQRALENYPLEDYGQLVATPLGWVCPTCGYTQTWAHDFMLLGPPPDPMEALR